MGPGDGATPADLRRVQVIVPRQHHAPWLRAALHQAMGGRACIAPRVQTLEDWSGLDAVQTPIQRADLFEALRDNAWVRERFGARAGALWSLARDAAALGDELTLAACGADEAFTGRWRSAIQRHFSQRAAAAGEPQAQLVLALWRAGLDPDRGALQLGACMTRRAAAADGPLLWLVPQGAAPWQVAYCHAYAERCGYPAVLIEGDDAALALQYPLLAAAWPEMTAALAEAPPIAQRAGELARQLRAPQRQAVHPQAAHGEDTHSDAEQLPPASLRAAGSAGAARVVPPPIWRCNSLEDEAGAAATWTLARVADGCSAIALVALDRLAARRVRALLDRAAIAVVDEAGWKLSTTSAAAAVMRWIDLVIADFAHDDLLDWLQSPFTLLFPGEGGTASNAVTVAGKAAIAAHVGAVLIEDEVRGGAAAVRAALARRAARPPVQGDPRAGMSPGIAGDALQMIDTLVACARSWQQPGSLGRYLGLLDATLDQLGMRQPLAADPVGAAVLAATGQLREQLAGATLLLDLGEFRAFLAEHFEEEGTATGAGVASPVVMTTLTGTRLRRFDAVLLIGADAEHLPGRRSAGGLLAGSVRRELGLPTDTQREREQLLDLASLIASTPIVAATWRQRDGDTPRPLSPLLDRLALVAELAGCGNALCDPRMQTRSVAAAQSPVRAPAPGWIPQRLSATAYQDLVDCPYRFFALRVLGLREAERLRPVPDKRDLGKVLHRALYEFHRDQAGAMRGVPGRADSVAGEAEALRSTIDAVFAPLLRQQPALIAYRQRLRQLVPGFLQWLGDDRRAGWRWSDGEAVLERPLLLDGPDAVTLFGRVDRIDAGPAGVRILDYKARDAGTLRRAQKDPGEAVQLLFYGLLLDPPAAEAAYLSLQPPRDAGDPAAGVATVVPAPAPFAQNVAQLGARIAQDLRRISGGAALPANGAESVCRRCELRSLCRHGFVAAAAGQPTANLDAPGPAP
jgi:ATP-dependent helicase/nuclease subunit B